LAFGGTEKNLSVLEWSRDLDKLKKDRTFNVSGIYTDEFGNTRFYDNETDNYQQDHYQLHWNEKLTNNWNLAFHYKRKGFMKTIRKMKILLIMD
jgi:iron complex outermembrane receptor protein